MNLALFDLDNTLIAGDSDHLWGEFLTQHNIVDSEQFRERNDQFYQDYQRGKLDIQAYLHFALEPLSRYSLAQLAEFHRQFMAEYIEPIILPKAQALVEEHRRAGDQLVIITATNRFITGPIAERFGISTLLASEAEIIADRYTGRPVGTPCYQHGKIERLQDWLKSQEQTFASSCFYSDSANDIPLLEWVDKPVVVDPDDRLHQYAQQKAIPVISLR